MAADINVINQVLTTMTTTSLSMSGNLIGEGQSLLAALTIIMVVYHLCLALLGNDWVDTQISIFQTLLKWAIVTVMLSTWSGLVVDTFSNKFNEVARQATGTSTTIASVGNLGINTIKGIFNLNASSTPASGTDAFCDPMTGFCSGVDPNTGTPATASSGLSMLNMMHLVEVVLGFILKCAAAFFVGAMIVAFIVIAFIGVFMLGVGTTVGPILVPFLVLPPMSYLFDGWIKFMITGGLIKVVAAIVIAIVGGVFSALSLLSVSLNDGSAVGVDITVCVVMCLLAAIGAYVMWQVPEFTSQLLQGGGGAAARGFSPGSSTARLIRAATKKGGR